MRDRLAIAGLVVLIGVAVWDRSAVMAVSVGGMALAWGAARGGGLGRRAGAATGGAVAAALAAEAVHTVYHRFAPSVAFGDAGGFWTAAVVIGLGNAVAFGAWLGLAEVLARRQARASRSSAS